MKQRRRAFGHEESALAGPATGGSGARGRGILAFRRSGDDRRGFFEKTREGSELTGPVWDRQYAQRGRLWGGTRLDSLTARVLDGDPSLVSGRWLDAGCGDGKGLVPLLSRLDPGAPPVVGLDVSRAALVHARAGVRERHGPAGLGRVRFVQGDTTSLPFPRGMFHGVRAVHLIGHLRLRSREQAMSDLVSALRPGGVLVVSEFGLEDFRAGKGVEVEPSSWRRGTGIETHYFSREELVALVEHAGGRVQTLENERFVVEYGGQTLPRQRWELTAAKRELDRADSMN